MRQTAGGRTALTPTAQEGTRRRMTPTTDGSKTAGGVQRPTLAGVPGRDKKPAGDRSSVGGGGWAGVKAAREQRTSKFPRVEVPEAPDVLILRFAEAEPFAFIYRHWVDKKPYTCIADPDNDIECPLCQVGHRAKPVVFYNVITVKDNTLRVWEMTAEPTRQVQKQYDKLAATGKTLDDPAFYFAATKAKKDNGFFEFDVERIRAADLAEETGLDPLDADELATATRRGLFTDELIQVSTKSDLRDAAEGIDDTDN